MRASTSAAHLAAFAAQGCPGKAGVRRVSAAPAIGTPAFPL